MTRDSCRVLDIECHPCGEEQAFFLVRLSDDVLWTNYIEDVILTLRDELERLFPDRPARVIPAPS